MVRMHAPLALLVLPVTYAYLAWVYRRSYVRLPRGQQRATLVLRLLLLTVVTGVVTQPELAVHTETPPLVALVDVSESVPDDVLASEQTWLEAALGGAGKRPFELVTFAGHPQLAPAGAAPVLARHDEEETDLAEALAFAGGPRASGAPRILLFTDGFETRGAARAQAERLAARGVVIDVARPPRPLLPDARAVSVRLPEVVRRGEPTRIAVTVASSTAGRAHLEVLEDDLLVDQRTLDLVPGERTVAVDVVPTRAGFVRYAAAVRLPGDQVPGNDRYERLVAVGGEPRILLCSSTTDEASHLEEALRANEIDVESVLLDSLPSSVESLLSYDAVVLAGVAPSELDRLRQAALAAYVRDLGGGLLFVAGANGLRRDAKGQVGPLDTALPLEPATPSERQVPPVALVMLIDRSGSMAGEKIQFAKQAAAAAVEKLSSNALVGVIAFDSGRSFDWLVPLQTIRDKESVKSAIRVVGAEGGTAFYPALEDAYYALGAAQATSKHIILLTDGISTDPIQLPPWLEHIRERSITLSTVGIGHDVDAKQLRHLAEVGGGVYHPVARAADVPNIFVDEARNVERDAIDHDLSRPRQLVQARELGGIEFSSAPPLRGYVRTRAKPSAEVLLEANRGDPLLARWRFGLGVVYAFSSDAAARWAIDWLPWEGYGKMWTQLVRGAIRPRNLDLKVIDRGAEVELAVEALDAQGRFVDDLKVSAVALDARHERHEVALPQSGPGRYVGRIALPQGTVIARPLGTRGDRPLDGNWAVLDRPYPRELERIGEDRALLDDLVRLTGGVRIDLSAGYEAGGLQAVSGSAATVRWIPLAMPGCMLALLLFLVDLGVKRTRSRGAA
jgi:uncharacterized membrane protein/uncharacterized protein YegL